MRRVDEHEEMDHASLIVDDIHNLLERLQQTFTTANGKTMHVRGDFTKLCMMPDLNARQRKMLHSLEMTGRMIPGTQEVRNLMGKYMTGCCVRYGVPFMCTLSPSVYHSMLVFHLHRGLEADPIYLRDTDLKRWISMDKPTLATYHDEDGKVSSCGIFVPLDGLDVPSFNQRQKIIAQDPLASVDGFRTMVQLVLRTMFGVRVCSDCPARSGKCACQDRFGSVSNVDGGVFGMVEAYAASIEAQLAGWLHTHILIYLSWIFQHMTMIEIAKMLIARTGAFANGLAELHHWKTRCCSETFAKPTEFNEVELDSIETAWSTRHRQDAGLLVHGYSSRVKDIDPSCYRAWQDKNSDLRTAMSNLHVHPKGQSKSRQVLRSCLKKSNKEKRKRQLASRKGQPLDESRTCKYGFPKMELPKPVVLCRRLARKVHNRAPGYRAKVGQLEGPRHGYRTKAGYCTKAVPLGETHPAIALVTGTNFHVRDTTKIPPVGAAHSAECNSKECRRMTNETIRRLTRSIAQIARQNVKYVTSYTSKTQPIAKEKIRNFGKIHDYRLRQYKAGQPISKDNRRQTLSNFARRGVARLLSDSITKARTMYTSEALLLMLYARDNDSTSAEAFYSASQVSFPCRQLRMELSSTRTLRCHSARNQRVSIQGKDDDARLAPDVCNFSAYLYGLRSMHEAIWVVPPYQFWLNWYFAPATYPRSLAQSKKQNFHCHLTEAGIRYFETFGKECDDPFIAGEHYVIRAPSGCHNGQHWVALHDDAPAEWKHRWVVVRHDRPKVPYFQHPFDPHASNESRKLAFMAYFSPWTSIQSAATEAVPYARTISTDQVTYAMAWQRYTTEGVPCTAVKQYIKSFMMMHLVGDVAAADSEDEDNCEDTTRLPELTTSELYETTAKGSVIDVKMWEMENAQRLTLACESDTRNALDFMTSAVKAAPTPKPRGFANLAEKPTWYTFYETRDVVQITDNWLRDRAQRNERIVPAQEKFIEDFTDYVKHRAREVAAHLTRTEDTEKLAPPNYFVTGMPGTGKSFVTQALRSLFDALGMEEGVDYIFTAFMASTARQSNGRTLHHVLGLGRNGKAGEGNIDMKRLQFIIIDEISMVAANFLAKLDVRTKIKAGGVNSPYAGFNFGGLVMVFVGDFVQLPPTGGTTLDTPPQSTMHHLTPDSEIRGGLKLFWDNDQLKLVELTEQVRCDDAWWISIWVAMRFGKLSPTDIDFLHGQATTVPGSFLDGAVLCKSKRCLSLVNARPHEVSHNECHICRQHRDDRHVVRSFRPDDERWKQAIAEGARFLSCTNAEVYGHGLKRAQMEAQQLNRRFLISCAHDVILWDPSMKEERKAKLKKAWLDIDHMKAEHLAGKVPIAVGVTVALSMHMPKGHREEYGLTKDRNGKIVGWKANEQEPLHTSSTTHFKFVPDIVYVQFFEKDGRPSSWQHPDVPGKPGVYPVEKTSVVFGVDGNDDRKVRRFQIPLVPGLSSTFHVAQGAEMSPIIKLDKMTTPTMVFVGITRSKRSNKCLIMPCDTFDFRVYSTGVPLNQKNELLLAHLRGDVDFEVNLAEYHRRAKSTKPKVDPRSVSLSRALAGQSGDRKRKSEGGQNGDRQRKREGGQNGDVEDKRKAGREGGRAGDVEAKRKAGRAGDVEAKRKAGRAGDVEAKRKAQRASNLAHSAATRRRHGHDDDALISPTSCIPGHASVRDRIDRAKGMTVRQAIQLTIYTTRSLKRDETAGYIRLVRASGEGDPDAVMCDAECDGLESDRSPMISDTDVRNPVDDFSD